MTTDPSTGMDVIARGREDNFFETHWKSTSDGDVQIKNSLQKEIRMNIYVGNLSYEVTEEDLRIAFAPFGQVESVNIIKDKYSGQSKGFGFVEMPSAEEARSAINDLNGKELKERTLNVNEARPRTESRGGGGGRGGGRRF